jgi:hypothetical protein
LVELRGQQAQAPPHEMHRLCGQERWLAGSLRRHRADSISQSIVDRDAARLPSRGVTAAREQAGEEWLRRGFVDLVGGP